MRRIAAVFSSSKRDKSASAPAPSHSSAPNTARRSFTNLSLSRKRNFKASVDTADLPPSVDSIPSTPQLSTGQSSGSSTGSASLQTHDEVTLPRAKGKLWISWLGKRTDTTKSNEQIAPETSWSSPPASRRPDLAGGLPLGIETGSESSESDEEQEEEEQEEEEVEFSHNIPDARQVLQVLTQNGLQHQFHSSPFVQRQASSMYPRSCNPSRMLRKQATVETLLHRRRLLKSLLEPITEQEAASLQPLQLKKVQALPVAQEPVDEAAPHKTDKIFGFSPGLRQWIARPPFEERLGVWLPIDETFTCLPVSSSFAVAAIEFSEAIEMMAYPSNVSTSPTPSPSSPRSTASTELPRLVDTATPVTAPTLTGISASYSKPAPQTMVSSPLRHDASPPLPAPPRSRSEDNEVAATSSTSSTTRRGVRFAEEDKEDNIPIGYVMRVKKQKEEKARFLREQREKRQFEEERRKHEQERLRRDQERAQWEKEKLAWENEKKAMEEERKVRLYAEEFAAARQRAEDQRNGMRVSNTSAPLRERADRNVQEPRRYSRLPYDAPPSPRNQGSEPTTPSPHTSSPSSSRPPSIAGPSGGNKPQSSGHSRPSSFYSNYTNSSEDIGHNLRPTRDRSRTAPARNPSTSSLFLPPSVPLLPVMPAIFTTDMPLLPPNAPFMMMNSYSQPRSNQSHSPSSSSRQSVQRNSSTESMDMQARSRSGASPRTSFISHSQTASSSSTRHPNHQRRTSDDGNSLRQSSNSSHPHIRPSHSHHSLPRGRSQQPAHNAPMASSPWTAMPSRTGTLPTVMPYSNNSGARTAPVRRQTAFS